MYKRLGHANFVKDLVIRVANSQIKQSYGNRKITIGTQCGMTLWQSVHKWNEFECRPVLSGKYIIGQSLGAEYLAIAELSVFIAGESNVILI